MLLGLLFGLLMRPYQALSELRFLLQRGLWLAAQPQPLLVCLVVFAATSLLVLLALDRAPQAERTAREALWLQQLSLANQLRRLPLMLLTHLGGLAVGVESPSVALGASVLLAIRRRWPRFQLLAALSPQLLAAIAAALGERWRGEGWNEHQVRVLLEAKPSAPQNPSATPSSR